MTIRDYRLLEAVTQLHDIARTIEQDVGKGQLSQQIRQSADDLANIIRIQEWVK